MNSIGDALRKIFDALKKGKKVRTQKEFANNLETYSHALNEMYKGKRPVTIRILERLYSTYNGNINFMISGGQGEMFRNGTQKAQTEDLVHMTILQQEVTHLGKELISKDKIITLLEQQLREHQTKKKVG